MTFCICTCWVITSLIIYIIICLSLDPPTLPILPGFSLCISNLEKLVGGICYSVNIPYLPSAGGTLCQSLGISAEMHFYSTCRCFIQLQFLNCIPNNFHVHIYCHVYLNHMLSCQVIKQIQFKTPYLWVICKLTVSNLHCKHIWQYIMSNQVICLLSWTSICDSLRHWWFHVLSERVNVWFRFS